MKGQGLRTGHPRRGSRPSGGQEAGWRGWASEAHPWGWKPQRGGHGEAGGTLEGPLALCPSPSCQRIRREVIAPCLMLGGSSALELEGSRFSSQVL